jgi:hypothetical protein
MTLDTLLFLEAAGPQVLLLRHLKQKNASVQLGKLNGLDVVFCHFVSSDMHYVHIKIRHPTDKEPEGAILLQIPHHSVLAVMQADRKKMIGFARAIDEDC